jgi:mitochondrial fission protein ELM1
VWVLETDAAGDNAQLRVLASALGWPTELKPLVFNRLTFVRNPFLGASTVTVDRRRSAPLVPPWPDLILSAGRHSVPVARSVRRRSGGRARLVHLGRLGGPLRWADLVMAPPQYGVSAGPNTLPIRLPFNRVDPARLADAADRWRPRLAHLPRPWIALLVGGPTMPLGMDVPDMRAIAQQLVERARATGGSVLATTSRRTPPAVTSTLATEIGSAGILYAWRPNDLDNPYAALLALADELVVTADSAAMLAEACRTGRPVAVAALPHRPSLRVRVNEWVARTFPTPYARLTELGLLMTARDFPRLHAPLRKAGAIRFLGEPCDGGSRPLVDDLPRAVAAVRALMSRTS